MIYGFLSDRALLDQTDVIELDNSPNTDVGFFDDQMANYFVTPAKIKDNRSTRLTILAQPGVEGIEFHFDASEDDDYDFNGITSDERECFFNIIEQLYLNQSLSDEDMEDLLTENSEYSDIYIADSFERSASTVESEVRYGTETLQVISAQDIRTYVSFSVLFDGATTVNFKIWVGRDAFLADYPISNISLVIPPCEPAEMLTPTAANAADAIADASAYATARRDIIVTSTDHSGILPVVLSYENDSFGAAYPYTFEVLYQGAAPTNTEALVAIKDLLEEYGDQEDWEELFPALYSVAQFWFVPIWDNTFYYEGTPVNSGIFSVEDYVTLLVSIFPTYGETAIREAMEVIVADGNEIIVSCLPDTTNDGIYTALSTVHDYQVNPASGDVLSSDTIAFSTAFAAAMAYAGETSMDLGDLVDETINGHDYITFTTGGVTYHVYKMTQS